MTFDLVPGADRRHLAQVLARHVAAGSTLVDTSPLYGMAEVNVGDFAAASGIGEQLFIANKIWSTGEYLADASHAWRSLEQSMQRLWRSRLDAMQCHSLVNVDFVLPLIREWKQDGLVGHVGVTHHEPDHFEPLARWVEQGEVDLVQVHYSIAMRDAERRILPAARDRGVGVLVNMPFEKARLFTLVEGRPVPQFAREIGIESWAAYFLKWVISHPDVTCALPATANPDHAAENVAALRGPLPDPALRERMAKHVRALPGFDAVLSAPWYPGKRYPGVIARARAARS
ncbi:aldo/keto reductase [Sphingomonas sp. BT-65]|uniref:aldo/keto reductase n=1 Tax=Sphingomonas sp. BT-65 TaxID=2989821 RepID=UPI0022368C5A|nr:aldo/keto reductase [Sphingomonas sp. BT-65]MCW4460726.1 aldo/keto reductase [Sphingomonas sp. BT-65]